MAPKDNIKQLRNGYENLLISGLMLSMVIMVLKFKFKWFRARLKFDDTRAAPIQTSSGVYRQSIDPEASTGVYRQSVDPELSWNYNGTSNQTVSNSIRSFDSQPQESIDSNEPEYLNEIPQTSLNNEYLTLTDVNDWEKLPELLETRPIFETVQIEPKLPKVERFEDDFKITKPKVEPRSKFLEIETKPIRTEFEYDDLVVEPKVQPRLSKVPSFEYDDFKIETKVLTKNPSYEYDDCKVEPKVPSFEYDDYKAEPKVLSKIPSFEFEDFQPEPKVRPISKIPSFEYDDYQVPDAKVQSISKVSSFEFNDFDLPQSEPKSIKVETFDDFEITGMKPKVKFLETFDDDFEVAENPKYQSLATKRNSDFMVNRSDLVQQEYSNAAANIFLRNQNQSRRTVNENRSTSLARPSVIPSQSPVIKHKSPEKSYKQKAASNRTKATINQAIRTEPTASISRISSRPITLGSSDDNLSISSQTSA